MKIKSEYKLRTVCQEHCVLMQGESAGDMSKVIALNESSYILWKALEGKEFEVADVKNLLLDEYEVSEDQALKDAQAWVDVLKQHGIVE